MNDIGLHELKCFDKKRKTNQPLNKRLDKNVRLKNFQQKEYAKKRFKKGKSDAKGYVKDVKEHYVFGQNVSKSIPSEIADALLKRDAEKFYNLQFPGSYTGLLLGLMKLKLVRTFTSRGKNFKAMN